MFLLYKFDAKERQWHQNFDLEKFKIKYLLCTLYI